MSTGLKTLFSHSLKLEKASIPKADIEPLNGFVNHYGYDLYVSDGKSFMAFGQWHPFPRSLTQNINHDH